MDAKETRNITLSLPKETLKRVKLIAVQRETSVSRMLAGILEELVAKEDQYEKAKKRHLAILERGFDLGTGGSISWTRDSLHER